MHLDAMEKRFPDFVHLFFYHYDGMIKGIDNTFRWYRYDYNKIIDYIICLVLKGEKQNIEKITNVEYFLDTIEIFRNQLIKHP